MHKYSEPTLNITESYVPCLVIVPTFAMMVVLLLSNSACIDKSFCIDTTVKDKPPTPIYDNTIVIVFYCQNSILVAIQIHGLRQPLLSRNSMVAGCSLHTW